MPCTIPRNGTMKTVAEPIYSAALTEKATMFLRGIRQRLFPQEVLVVGPYAGEFGHEIMDFQARVRWNARRYREVHVITYPGRDPLYRAQNVTVYTHDFDLKTAGYCFGRRTFRELDAYAESFAVRHGIADYDIFNTNLLCTRWHRRLLWPELHVPFSSAYPPDHARDLVFHFRQIQKAGPDTSRNFKKELVEELVARTVAAGYRLTCIGHPKYAFCPSGCEDCRTEDMDKTVGVILSGRLTVGELSGPIHLAVYLRKPVLTWAPEYHRIWAARRRNPYKVPIFSVADDTTNPSVDRIVEGIGQVLKRSHVLDLAGKSGR